MELQKPNKKVMIETWGCQMNVADSEHMLGLLKSQHYQTTDVIEDADLILLNTCHIREKARHKVVSRLGRIAHTENKKPNLQIAVAGCVAQAEGKKLIKAAPNIDILVSPGKISQLPELLRENKLTKSRAVALGFEKHATSTAGEDKKGSIEARKTSPSLIGRNQISRFINIVQGCDNFCTFCIVPFTRGREISRMPEEILTESKMLVASGAKEITIVGQNVNSYGNDLVRDSKLLLGHNESFIFLLKEMLKLNGLERLRFTTSNPHDFTKPIADLFAVDSKMGKYIHLPVQSGSDSILEKMKRKVTIEQYYERIRWLKKAHPDMAISTDIIVGFPGETEDDFKKTVELVENVRFSFIYCFKYSSRAKTAAARFADQVPDDVMARRLSILNEVQNKITIEQNLAEVGHTREVLFLYPSRKEADVYYGRTEHFRLVLVRTSDNPIGKTLPVKITKANKTALEGEFVSLHLQREQNQSSFHTLI